MEWAPNHSTLLECEEEVIVPFLQPFFKYSLPCPHSSDAAGLKDVYLKNEAVALFLYA